MKLYQEAEKFINDNYWQGSHDKRSKLEIEKLVAEKLLADEKKKDPEYFNHREGVVHVSSLSKCLRGVVHELMGHARDEPDDARQLGVFKAGNLFEDFIIASLGDRVVEQQREYVYKYKSLTLVGRSDYTILDDGVMRIGENKSVHSDTFWYREKEGCLVAWNNQIQLQVYMWLERILNGNAWEGIFSYVSKDDVTVKSAAVKFNQAIIDEIVLPALEILNEAYEKKDPNFAPVPDSVVYNEAKHQYQKNWLCTYCNHHAQCSGSGWVMEATELVTRKNKELKDKVLDMPHMKPKEKKTISVV